VNMYQELLAMLTPEEQIAEFGTIEQKRAYIAEKRAEDPNWVNIIFPPGRAKQGLPLQPAPSWGHGRGHSGNRKAAAKPTNSRDAKKHSRRH